MRALLPPRVIISGRVYRTAAGLVALALGLGTPRAAGTETRVAVSRDYVSRRWITDDGLPHNVVTRIHQDRTGYLWLATLAGLARFDGREFRVFLPPDRGAGGGRNARDLAVLDDGTVVFLPASGGVWQVRDGVLTEHPASRDVGREDLRELHAEPQGALWLGTLQGVVRWERGRIERFGREQGILRRMLPFSFATDAQRRTWVAGPDFVGIYRDGKLVAVNAAAGIVYRVAPAQAGGVWVWGNGLMKSDGETLVPLADAPWPLGQASARWMFEDPAGGLWVATSRAGVFRFDGRQFQSLPGVEPSVEHITMDHEGSVWLATDGGGMRRLRTKIFSLVEAQVSSVCEDAAGALWFANGLGGVVRWSGEAQQTFSFRVARAPLHVSAVGADPQGNLWMASPLGLFQTSVDDPATARRINAAQRNLRVVFCARNGDVWVAGGGVLGWYRGEAFTPVAEALGAGDEITTIAEQPAGHLWIGTARGSLLEFSDGQLRRSTIAMGGVEAAIHGLLPDPTGAALWLATAEGLVLAQEGRVRRFTQADGLPDDIVLQVLADDADHLWLGTPRGLFRVARTELLARANDAEASINPIAYGPEQGLSGVSPTGNYQPAAWKDRRGALWFCTYRGAIGIHPERLPRAVPPPPVLIDEVRLNERAIDSRGILRVPAGGQRLAFRFAALSFAAPEQVRVRHQLEGFDADWIDTAPDRTARYAKLPPGDYRLGVIACNSEGGWNREGAALAFTVLPAWWQTAWFRLAAALGSAGLIGWGARAWSQRKFRARLERLEREHALEKERARIARDMHDELGGSVTGINLLVQRLRDQRPAANGVVDLLDRRVRRLTLELERVVWTVSPKNCSLEQLAAFIERFAQNLFADSPVRCRVHGRETIPPRPLNPECQHHVLAVTKEAINNVLKHSHATEASVTLSFANEAFALSIRDNGAGFAPEAQEHSERNGLRNMRTRVAELGGTLEIRSAPGAGAEIALRVPIGCAAKTP